MTPAEAQVYAASTQTQGALIAAGIAAIVALLTSVVTARVTLWSAEQRLRREFQLEYAAERVAHELMRHPRWKLRSLALLRLHLGGFEDDELRKILVRAGAIRFESKTGIELWGLLELNRGRLGTKIDEDPVNPPQTPRWVRPSKPAPA